MSVFVWTGRQNKMLTRGEIKAKTEALALLRLESLSISVIAIAKRSTSRKISTQHKLLFYEQLKNCYHSGMSISEGLQLMNHLKKEEAFSNTLFLLQAQLKEGYALSACLKTHEKHFDPLATHLIHAGENSGKLEEALTSIIHYYKQQIYFKKMIGKAIAYPAIVCITACLLTLGLLVFIVPEFTSLFFSSNIALPILTCVIINLSDFVLQDGLFCFGFMAVTVILIAFLKERYQRIHRFFINIKEKLPIIRTLKKIQQHLWFFHVMRMAYEAGLPLSQGVSLLFSISSDKKVQTAYQLTHQKINDGETLTQALSLSMLFEPYAIALIRVGEKSGTLSPALQHLAVYYTSKLENFCESILRYLEPVALFILAIIIGVIIMALYLPILQMGLLM